MGASRTIKSTSYDGRYLSLKVEQISSDVATNSSVVKWTLTSTGGSVNYYATGPTKVEVAGNTVYSKTRMGSVFPAAKGSVSGTKTVYHDEDGTKTISIFLTTAIYTTTTTRWSTKFPLDPIARYATLESAPDFTDEQSPTITYSNPAGESVTSLQACITLDGSDPNVDASVVVPYRDVPITGTSYTFNDITYDELYKMQYATTGSNSRKVWFKLKSVIGSNTGYSQLERTFTIANPNPTINPIIVDTNATTIALTGDSNKLIRYYSDANVTINAAAVKAATLTGKKVTCGGATLTDDGTITGVTNSNFVFTATDSRGNVTIKTVTPPFVNYIKPTCIIANTIPDVDGNMTVQANGNYFNASFGKEYNALNVYYRYKKASDEWTESDTWTLMPVTLNGNTYFAATNITGLDYQTAYTFQTYARDVLVTTSISENNVKATPVFDWGENDFKFNVPVYDEFNTVIRNGKAAYTGTGTSAVDPNTTTEELCLTDHANGPRQGYWFFIRTMFYGDLSTTTYRAQIATPSSTGVSAYYRVYSSDTGWSAWRRQLNEDENYMRAKTLWYNANTTSAFANQTLSLDLSEYDFVSVEFLTNCSSGAWKSYRITMTVPVNHETEWKNYKAVGFSETGSSIGFRAFHMGSDTIRFGESYYATAYGVSSLTTNNNLYIPLRIYGIKGVS